MTTSKVSAAAQTRGSRQTSPPRDVPHGRFAERAGSTIGGLLNISFGNTAELILALFVLSRAQVRIVQAQITGSIIGTTLLFLGISALVGGVGRVRQTFNQASAGLLSTLLFLVVVAILRCSTSPSGSPHPG